MFSALYTPVMMLLFALILRGISFEIRDLEEATWWRKPWDVCHVLGSFLPALLLGVAFANIFAGVPIDAEGGLQGNLLTLLNPHGLLGGVLVVLQFTVHGALWLSVKSVGALPERAQHEASLLWNALLVVAVAFLAYTWFATRLWQNVLGVPVLLVLPLLAVAALLETRLFRARRDHWRAWFASCLTIVATPRA